MQFHLIRLLIRSLNCSVIDRAMSTKRIVYQSRIEKIIDHTPLVRELVFKLVEPQNFEFRAGQFVMLHVPQAQVEKPALRAYSIASDDRQTNGFRLLFKYVKDGLASTFVWNLKGGETVEFTGPFGRVFFHEPPDPQIFLLCTGTGLAPHFSYLVSKADQYPNLRYRLLFGLYNEAELYYQAQLDALKKTLKDFSYEIVLSSPEKTWTGKKGFIQDHLLASEYQKIPTSFYLCGNGKMIQQTKALLTERDNRRLEGRRR